MNPKKSLSNYVYFIREYGTQVVINGDPEKGNKHLYWKAILLMYSNLLFACLYLIDDYLTTAYLKARREHRKHEVTSQTFNSTRLTILTISRAMH